jgi:hypothetical protein
MANDNPCHGCTERHGGCHATCPKGIAWKEKDKERRAKIKAARQKEVQVTSTLIERKESIKRKRSK